MRYDTVGTNVKVSENDDIISNSGKAPISTTEGFGLTRLNNSFGILDKGPLSSKIAQSEDETNNINIIPSQL